MANTGNLANTDLTRLIMMMIAIYKWEKIKNPKPKSYLKNNDTHKKKTVLHDQLNRL